jgi:malonate decarboxylase beta subunit
MDRPSLLRPADRLRDGTPRARLRALADGDGVEWLDAPRPSAHLARYGIAAQEDDGVVTARLRIRGRTWLAAAQDERFLRGSVGAAHGDALRALFERACVERPDGVLLLAGSGGVRLHEADAAELALGRALRALIEARAQGIASAAIATGDVFGGASVLACACERFAAVADVRIGLSGPKVVEVARGRQELDASDAASVNALYGAAARVSAGAVEGIGARVDEAIDWLAAPRGVASFGHAVRARQHALATPAPAIDVDLAPAWQAQRVAGLLWRSDQAWIVAPWRDRPVDAASLSALDEALLTHVVDGQPRLLILLEDSPGHEVSRAAEARFLSRYLAHHACVLGLLRARGVRIAGALMGTGHSAAFFAHALQADALCAVPDARVVAMAPDAIARVTGVDAARLMEDDPLLGQPVRHFAALGGIRRALSDASAEGVLAFARSLR